MVNYPIIYQINFRVWFKGYKTKKGISSVRDIPVSTWLEFKQKGIDIIWLMGVWKTVPSSVKKYCFESGLINEYDNALPDWKEEDVIGSPYAIDSYTFNPELGSDEDLKELKSVLDKQGLKLVLDFIPNHFHADSSLIESNSDIFLPGTDEMLVKDGHTFYRSEIDNNIYCHGRDPYFPAWQDTIQINFFHPEARKFLTEQLLRLTEFCDGVRCDMAMLALAKVFENTWGEVLKTVSAHKPEKEFWQDAIRTVKEKRNDFLFIGEAYWNTELTMQKIGFDFTYDKSLYDKLLNEKAPSIREHLRAGKLFQQKSIRFIENHDEKRAVSVFGLERSKSAANIISSVMGAKLFFHGQFEGKKVKLPVQLGREPIEQADENCAQFYNKLLKIVSLEIFKNGEWLLIENFPSWEEDLTYKNILCLSWRYMSDEWLVTINYSDSISSCRIFPDGDLGNEYIQLDDELNSKYYRRNYSDLQRIGLYIELKPYSSHMFKVC